MITLIALAAVALSQAQPAAIPHHQNQILALAKSQSNPKVRFGKYEAELRIPEGGLYSQEEVDVEMRVVDTTQNDPIETGFKGVGAIEVTAEMTMPAMAGMPVVRPKVHREGVPGEYGIPLFFPHGGDFKIDLNLAIPGNGEHKISFTVSVQDERPAGQVKTLPYQLKVVGFPAHARAGKPIDLKMQVVDTKTGLPQVAFDEAHTKFFHLMIASHDLNWFVHEHPVMSKDGTWSISQIFPAGGKYWVYGDVAPAGQGSRVLIAQVEVSGKKPNWDTLLHLTTVATDGGLKGLLSSMAPIKVGHEATLQVKLFNVKTGKPAIDTEKWLGAAGHMMIFIKDGQTVVHSHPADDAENEALVRKGMIRFNGRFPKAGTYKIYAQFSWHGKVRTLGFAINVK